MPQPSMSLIVLRCADLQKSLAFYQALGLEFVEEQHGSGPIHYASELVGGMVIELYPGKPGTAPERTTAGAAMIGFRVSDLLSIIPLLEERGGTVITPPKDGQWGRRAMVQDLDGRAIDLSEPPFAM